MSVTYSYQGPSGVVPELTRQKLIAFEGIESEFIESFQYKEAVHGQQRFEKLSIADSVRYLHALWVCERKDALLSVPYSKARYEGRRCLELLREWQKSDSSSVKVVAFLHRKLDMLEFAELTRQVDEAQQTGKRDVAERLIHGRMILLNRNFNLLQMLDAIFSTGPDEMSEHVLLACHHYGHGPEQIEQQLAEMQSRLYSWAPHPALARRNMEVMNHLGVSVTENAADRPGSRTDRVAPPTLPQPAYAEQTIVGEITFATMAHNNPAGLALAVPPLSVDAPDVPEGENWQI
ncbi:MAG TPA: hypothetical protein VF510_22400 [Ktedonobacterales bacterium]